jgi:TatD DNase family protein
VIDTHCHLDVPAFDADRDEVLARAWAAGVEAIVVPAIRPPARRWADARIRVAIGVHPQIVPSVPDDIVDALDLDGAIAVGECGLDGKTGDAERQERIFRRQIAIAREARLPLLVHVLGAHDRAPRILREEKTLGGIMHSYSGSAELVDVYRDLGFAFSFAGAICRPNARKPVEAARRVPASLLLAETDAPDQSPISGTRCEPAHVALVIEAIGRARGSTEDVRALTTANARRILRL